jgi:hypothetical protein
MLKREQEENSRLFVVNAGLDVAALRTQYSDCSRYASGGRLAFGRRNCA